MSRFILLLFIAMGMGLEGCGDSGADNFGPTGSFEARILGGEDVREGDPLARSVVMVGQSGFEECSATLLSDSVAVTAAHCVDPFFKGEPASVEGFFVKFRSPGLPFEERTVEVFVAHPKWTATAEELRRVLLPRIMSAEWRNWHDVALVRFAGGLPAGYEAALLLPKEEVLREGARVVLAGFGSRADSTLAGPDHGVLRRVSMEIAEPAGASIEFVFHQEAGRGSCKGDSGGPAYVEKDGRFFLLGTTSRAVGDVQNTVEKLCRQDSVYTDLRQVEDWLLSARAQLETK